MKIGIIGAGPSGVMTAIEASKNIENEITLIDENEPLMTLLPTGGGRCNLAHCEYDNSELIKFYPRGGRFLLSVFSRFATGDTIDFFEKIGVKTYVQKDLRIFPVSNSAKTVKEAMLTQLKNKNVKIIKKKVISFKKDGDIFIVQTQNNKYIFDKLVFSGGIKKNYDLLKEAKIELIAPKPALCALCIEEKELYSLAGVTLNNVTAIFDGKKELADNLLITHNSISGPLAYKISSLNAYHSFPYKIHLNFVNETLQEFDKKLITLLNENSKRNFANILSQFIPHSFALYLLRKSECPEGIKASQIDKKLRKKIVELLCNYELKIISQKPDGEIVTAGGVNLDFINPKTLEYKSINNLYFCGEVLNVDGYTGGFNLQFCWSSGHIVGSALLN